MTRTIITKLTLVAVLALPMPISAALAVGVAGSAASDTASNLAAGVVTRDYIHCNEQVYAEMNRLAELLRREANSRRPSAARVAALKKQLATTVAELR